MILLRLVFVWIPAALFNFCFLCLVAWIGHDFMYFSMLGLKPNNHAKGCGCPECQANRKKIGQAQDLMIPIFCGVVTVLILSALWIYGKN